MMGTIIEEGFDRTVKRASCPFFVIKEGFPEEMVFEQSAIGIDNYGVHGNFNQCSFYCNERQNPDCSELTSEGKM